VPKISTAINPGVAPSGTVIVTVLVSLPEIVAGLKTNTA
jgi:hypothetical protein